MLKFRRTLVLFCLALVLIIPKFADSYPAGGADSVQVVLAQGDDSSAAAQPDSDSTPSDIDGDGIPDDQDACPDDAFNTCNLPLDTDGDGIPDDQDSCPSDPSNTCNLPPDTDGDGIPDDQDACSDDPSNLCNQPVDKDGDGIPDDQDTCPDDPTNVCNLPPDTDDGVATEETPTDTPTPTETPTATATGTPDAPVEAAATTHVSVGGRVWYDSNNNGIRNQGEPGAAGVTVYVALCDAPPHEFCDLWFTLTTDSNGYYWATGLLAGSWYQLSFRAPNGYRWTLQNQAGGNGSVVDPNGVVYFKAPSTGSNRGGPGTTDLTGYDAGLVKVSVPTPTPPAGGFPIGSKVATTSSGLKMRSGAGTNYSALYTLASGVKCTVLGGPVKAGGYQWYRLDCLGTGIQGATRVGWVAGSYLKADSAPAATPTRTPTPAPGSFAVGTQVKTTTSNLKMRSGAGTNFGVLFTLGSGVKCKVLGGPTASGGYQWYRLDCGSSRVGWVAGKYLKKA